LDHVTGEAPPLCVGKVIRGGGVGLGRGGRKQLEIIFL